MLAYILDPINAVLVKIIPNAVDIHPYFYLFKFWISKLCLLFSPAPNATFGLVLSLVSASILEECKHDFVICAPGK